MKFFNTDGIRGKALDLICSNIVVKLAQILAEKSKNVVIGYDTRVSSPQIVDLLINGFVTKGCNVDVIQIVSTPMVSYFIKKTKKYDYGIMVTASHNPYYDNGIKIFNSNGEKIDNLEIEYIKEKFNLDYQFSLKDLLGRVNYFNIDNQYLEYINSLINFKNQYKIVVDLANGSLSYIKDKLKLDNIEYVNYSPNGKNINDQVGACFPEKLQQYLINNNADYGFCFDGDGDRLVMVSKDKIYDGNDLMINFINYFHYQKNVFTKIANQGAIEYCKKNNKDVLVCDVGDSNVVNLMKIYNADFGGEESGHFIFKENLYSDSLYSMVKILEIINKGTLIDYYKYYSYSYNLAHSSSLYQNKQQIIDTINQMINKDDHLIIRESGTENKLRFLVQSKDQEVIEKIKFYFTKMEN